jgi:PASTA domain
MADPETVTVPSVVGLTQSAAEATLKSAGLLVGKTSATNSTVTPMGIVSTANPPSGTSVSSGSAVDLEISSGPAQIVAPNADAPPQPPSQVAVPNLIGLTRRAAEAILKSAGLVLGAVKTQHSNSVPAGGISSTDPEAGTLVKPASPVALDLSSGPEPIWTQYIPTGLFALLGIIVLGLIVYAITQKDQEFLSSLANKEVARGLITFLITVATVGIAIILAISTLVLTEGDEGDKRFDRGKQVLSVLIGVLGTIVGFYFGAETSTARQATPTEQTQGSTQKITTSALPDGYANKSYPSTTLQSTGLVPPLKWSVTPPLPSGLALDGVTGTLSGTPTAPLQKTPFKFTVTDSSVPAVTSFAELKLEIKQ